MLLANALPFILILFTVLVFWDPLKKKKPPKNAWKDLVDALKAEMK